MKKRKSPHLSDMTLLINQQAKHVKYKKGCLEIDTGMYKNPK